MYLKRDLFVQFVSVQKWRRSLWAGCGPVRAATYRFCSQRPARRVIKRDTSLAPSSAALDSLRANGLHTSKTTVTYYNIGAGRSCLRRSGGGQVLCVRSVKCAGSDQWRLRCEHETTRPRRGDETRRLPANTVRNVIVVVSHRRRRRRRRCRHGNETRMRFSSACGLLERDKSKSVERRKPPARRQLYRRFYTAPNSVLCAACVVASSVIIYCGCMLYTRGHNACPCIAVTVQRGVV